MRRLRVLGLVLGVLVAFVSRAVALSPTSPGGCAASAEAAIARYLAKTGDGGAATGGYRVVTLRVDPVQRRSWALVASCSEAAKPMIAIELRDAFPGLEEAVAASAGVRIGDKVKVMSSKQDSRTELTGWAVDSGSVRDWVRVRLPKFSADEADAPPVIRCRVVGADTVEVMR